VVFGYVEEDIHIVQCFFPVPVFLVTVPVIVAYKEDIESPSEFCNFNHGLFNDFWLSDNRLRSCSNINSVVLDALVEVPVHDPCCRSSEE
jgi:hypothetical protein